MDSRQLFEILVRDNQGSVRAFLLSAVRDPALADDLLQEAFLVAWKNLDRYAKLVDQPKHVCTDCGRVANNKKMLCEPKKLPAKAKKATSPPSS